MKKITNLLIIFSSFHSFSQNNLVTIRGHIKGLTAGTMIYLSNNSADVDSIRATTNGFTIRRTITDGKGVAYIVRIGSQNMGNNFKIIYAQPGEVRITGDRADFSSAKLSGSFFARQQQELMDTLRQRYVRRGGDSIFNRYITALKAKDTSSLPPLSRQLADLDSIRGVSVQQWISAHPSSPVSVYALYMELRNRLSVEQQEAVLQRLTAEALHNVLADELFESIALQRSTQPGQMAMNFTQPDTAGRPVSLTDFRGKYVLVDFWASWCGPCRKENPNVVKLYDHFKAKNFTILSVSLDKQKDKWLQAIYQDGLTWTHVSDLKFWDNEAAKRYDIRFVPANLLIDPQGKIVLKNLHGEELEKKLSEIFN